MCLFEYLCNWKLSLVSGIAVNCALGGGGCKHIIVLFVLCCINCCWCGTGEILKAPVCCHACGMGCDGGGGGGG